MKITVHTYDDEALVIGYDQKGLNLIEHYVAPHNTASFHVHRQLSLSVTAVPPKGVNAADAEPAPFIGQRVKTDHTLMAR